MFPGEGVQYHWDRKLTGFPKALRLTYVVLQTLVLLFKKARGEKQNF